ncbi:MAG TPA: S8 family serine peptidase [bacterium]|nr:S8 family serine peptidase [bacterium]
MKKTSLLSLALLVTVLSAAGCGGGGLSGTEQKLTGQWVAEKLNAKGDRILLIFNGSSVATPPEDDTPYNPYDKPKDSDPHSIEIVAIRSAGDAYNVDKGKYEIEKNKLNFDLAAISDFSSPFTITAASGNAPAQLTLGTDVYFNVIGDLSGPQLGGQIQIAQGTADEGVTVSSVKTAAAIIPGEILVKYKDEETSASSETPEAEAPSGRAALTVSSASLKLAKTLTSSFVQRVAVRRGYHKLTIASSTPLGLSALSVEGAPKTLSDIGFAKLDNNEQLVNDTKKACEELSKDPNVEYCVPNRFLKVQSLAAPTDTFYGDQWNLDAMNVTDAWGAATPTKTVTVAVIDTGIVDHPDLTGRVLKNGSSFVGYDFIHDKIPGIDDLDLDGSPGPDSDPTDPGDHQSGLGLPGGSSWHGTHISGIIAAAIDNGTGIAGIAPSVQILPIRAMGYEGNGTLDDVAQAIYYAAKLKNIADCATGTPVNDGVAAGTYDIDESSAAWTGCDAVLAASTRPKADIINMSLGALLDPGSAAPLTDAVNAAAAAGVLVVTASGNEASGPVKCKNASDAVVDCFFYPAANPNALSIGAVYQNLSFATAYSNYGGDGSANNQFLVAPGGSGAGAILSTVNPTVLGGYAELMGTSQAAAHVTGVAALVWSEHPTWTGTAGVANVKNALAQSAVDLGDAGRDKYYGYGLVNACGALLKGREIAGTPSSLAGTLKLSSSNVDFGTLGATHTVVITGGCGTVSGITATKHTDNGGSGWLSASLTNGTTPSQMTFTINREGLAAGDYTATVTVHSSAGDAPISIKMKVGTASTSTDTGSPIDNLRKEISDFLSGGGSGYSNTEDIGEVIVLLIDANSGAAAYYTKTDLTANYNWQFGGINPGSYYVLAGIDENQDGTICKDGETEPCLAYPNFSDPQPVEVTATSKQNDLVLIY